METHVSITLSKLFFPSTTDFHPDVMELSYENKIKQFNYPLNEPIKITFSQKFIQDKITLVLSTIIYQHNKKQTLLYRGEVILDKTIFSDNRKIYRKHIILIPIESVKNIKKAGKILMEIQLLDSIDEWKQNISNKANITKTNNNKQNKIKEVNTNYKNQFDDNISLVEVSDLDLNNLELNNINNIDINQLFNIDYINQLKTYLQSDYQNFLPHDINSLKTYNENIYKKYQELDNKYNGILNSLNSDNEYLRDKAIEYFNNYKKLKKELLIKRKELQQKNKQIKSENSIENQNEILYEKYKNYQNEKEVFMQKISLNDNNTNSLAVISCGINNNEIKMLSDAVKKIFALGYDIVSGVNLNEDEKKLLSVIIGENLCENNGHISDYDENNDDFGYQQEESKNLKDDFDIGNEIVTLIERDVNELYQRKFISQVKIDQIDAITYSFSDDFKKENVTFKIENNNLMCTTGESFTVWLMSNFGI